MQPFVSASIIFHSFSCLNNIPLFVFIYIPRCIYLSPVDGHRLSVLIRITLTKSILSISVTN